MNCIFPNAILECNFSFETIGSIVAIFIGLCALGVSIWQGIETRKNYHLSVTPNLSCDGEWVMNSEIIGVFLRNTGIGPAIIDEIEILLDDKRYFQSQNSENFQLALGEKFHSAGFINVGFRNIDVGEIIPSGDNKPFIWMVSDSRFDLEKIEKFRSVIRGMKIKIEYKSFYNKKFILNIPHNWPIL